MRMDEGCLAEQPAREWKSSIMDDETKARINAEIDALIESQLDPTNGSDVVNIGANFPYCDACLSLLDEPVVVPDCTHAKLVCRKCMVRMRVNFESHFCCVDCAAEAGSSDEEAWTRAVVAHLIAAPLNPNDPEEGARCAQYFKQAIDFTISCCSLSRAAAAHRPLLLLIISNRQSTWLSWH